MRVFTRVLDVNRDVVNLSTLDATVTLSRQLNAATEVTITVPHGKQFPVGIGAFVQRVRPDGTVVATGRISRRDVTDQGVVYSAFLDAILLANNVTPANYSGALRNTLLADFAVNMLDGWRVKQAALASPVAQSGVDLGVEPGRVLLAKDGTGAYLPNGHVVYRFYSTDIPEFKRWERVRWTSDFFDNVATTMQWRAGTSGAWSPEIAGVDPSGAGLAFPPGTTAAIIEVRINLTTADTETPNPVPEGESPTAFGFTPRVFGVELIARSHGQIQVGSIDVGPDVFVRNLDADRSNALRLLQEVCEDTGHEFDVIDGFLHLAKQLGSDRTNDFILSAGHNVNVSVLRDDDEGMVNRLHAYGPDDTYTFLEDEDSVARFGPYEDSVVFEGISWEADAQAFLEAHATPTTQFEVSGALPAEVHLGDKVRIAHPTSGVVTATRATEIIETESPEGHVTTLLLGDPPPGLAQQILDEANEAEQREYQLGLPAPFVRAITTSPGFAINVQNPPRSRGMSFIVHVSTERGFTPGRDTEWAHGRAGTWQNSNATPGTIYYIRAVAVDRAGEQSEPSDEIPVRSGHVPEGALDPDLAADIAYSKVQAAVVEAGAQTWSDISQLVTDERDFWDAGGKQTDGLVLTGSITARTGTTITVAGRDWAAEGIQKGDQLRFPSTTPLDGRVFTVESVAGATLTVTPAMSPLPDVGVTFQVGRVARITALGISQTDTELRTQLGSIEDDLDGDAFTSSYSAVRQSAELAQSGLTRMESTLMLTGETTDAGADTVTDVNHNFTNAGILKGDVVYISDGPHAGLSRPIESVSGSVITLAEPFPVTIPTGTEYRVGRVNAVYGSAVTQTADEWRSVVGTLNEDAEYAGQFSSIKQLRDRIQFVVGDLDALEGLVDALDATGSLEPMTTVNGISMTTVDGVDMTTSVERGLSAVFTAIAMNQNQIDMVASQTSTHYSLIQQNADQITQRVRNGVFTSTVNQLSNEIGLKVDADGVITAINLSDEGVLINANRIGILSSDNIGTGTITAEKILNGSITGVLIENGAITATKLAANAVTADKIQAGAITTSKLAAGEIEISNTDRTTGRITAKDATGTIRATFGYLNGRHGSPSGAYGFGASLGDGAWIEGVPRIVYANRISGSPQLHMILSASPQYAWAAGNSATTILDTYPVENLHLGASGIVQWDSSILYTPPSGTSKKYAIMLTNARFTDYRAGSGMVGMGHWSASAGNPTVTGLRGSTEGDVFTGAGALRVRFTYQFAVDSYPQARTITQLLPSSVTVLIIEYD